MLFDGAFGDHEPGGDGGVRASLRQQGQHLALARAEVVERIAAAGSGEEPADDLGVDGGAAGRDPIDGRGDCGVIRYRIGPGRVSVQGA